MTAFSCPVVDCDWASDVAADIDPHIDTHGQERCRCTTVRADEPTPVWWRDLDDDGIIEWCLQCDDGIGFFAAEP